MIAFPVDACGSPRRNKAFHDAYCGTHDGDVHPDMTLAVINALRGANMTCDAFVCPSRSHSLAGEPYTIHLGWDDSVRHPPHERPPTHDVIRQPR